MSNTEVNDRELGIGVFGMEESWIKLHRKILGHWVYTRPEYLSIWVYLLVRANWKPSKAILNGRIVTIERGEVLTSIRGMAKGSHTTQRTVRTFLTLAQQDEMIELKSDTAATRVKILNYNRLQEVPTSDRHTPDTRATHGRHTPDTIIRSKEVKKVRREEEEVEGAAHRTRPSSHVETVDYFATLGMPADEAQRFTDYYTANGWKVGRNPMKDWKAAARNWRKGYTDKQMQSGNTAARTQPVGLPAQVIEIANRPKLSSEAVETFKQAYLSKVSPDE